MEGTRILEQNMCDDIIKLYKKFQAWFGAWLDRGYTEQELRVFKERQKALEGMTAGRDMVILLGIAGVCFLIGVIFYG